MVSRSLPLVLYFCVVSNFTSSVIILQTLFFVSFSEPELPYGYILFPSLILVYKTLLFIHVMHYTFSFLFRFLWTLITVCNFFLSFFCLVSCWLWLLNVFVVCSLLVFSKYVIALSVLFWFVERRRGCNGTIWSGTARLWSLLTKYTYP